MIKVFTHFVFNRRTVWAGVILGAAGIGAWIYQEYQILDGPTRNLTSWVEPKTNIPLIKMEAGCFEMGDQQDSGPLQGTPIHEVCLDPFWIGQFEVTQEQWSRIMDQDLAHFKGRDRPIESINFVEAEIFVKRLNQFYEGDPFTIPTEAQWEYACRAKGQAVRFGNGQNQADPQHINFDGRAQFNMPYSKVGAYRSQTLPVGKTQPNSIKLFDFSGNVAEWVKDDYESLSYFNHTKKNPVNIGEKYLKVIRGGSWHDSPQEVRCQSRSGHVYEYRSNRIGFRIARKVSSTKGS